MINVNPEERLEAFLKEGVRPDGRKVGKFRKTIVVSGSISTASGSALVQLGSTSVIAGVRAEVGPPLAVTAAGEPRLGCQVAVNVDFPPLCSQRFRGGRVPEEAVVMAQRINAIVASTELVPPESLVFDTEGALVWYLRVDLYCLNFDGAVFDALLLATVAALRGVVLCRGHVTEGGAPEKDDGSEFPLSLSCSPVSSTFAVFGKHVLPDPTLEEESLQEAALTVVCDGSGSIYEIHKPGGAAVSDSVLSACITEATARAVTAMATVEKALAK